MSFLQTQRHSDRLPAAWRTPTAIGLALAAGVPISLFLCASAVPFGPILVGWFLALGGAVVVTAGLCVLATGRFVTVGTCYAASVATTAAVATIAKSGVGVSWWEPFAQFGVIFSIVAFASLFGSIPCALIKWEDKRARERARKFVLDDQPRPTNR